MDKQIDLQPSLVSPVEASEGDYLHKTPSLPHFGQSTNHNWVTNHKPSKKRFHNNIILNNQFENIIGIFF